MNMHDVRADTCAPCADVPQDFRGSQFELHINTKVFSKVTWQPIRMAIHMSR